MLGHIYLCKIVGFVFAMNEFLTIFSPLMILKITNDTNTTNWFGECDTKKLTFKSEEETENWWKTCKFTVKFLFLDQ